MRCTVRVLDYCVDEFRHCVLRRLRIPQTYPLFSWSNMRWPNGSQTMARRSYPPTLTDTRVPIYPLQCSLAFVLNIALLLITSLSIWLWQVHLRMPLSSKVFRRLRLPRCVLRRFLRRPRRATRPVGCAVWSHDRMAHSDTRYVPWRMYRRRISSTGVRSFHDNPLLRVWTCTATIL